MLQEYDSILKNRQTLWLAIKNDALLYRNSFSKQDTLCYIMETFEIIRQFVKRGVGCIPKNI